MKEIKQTMVVDKETPGTFRFKDENEDSVCPVVYVKKSAFTGKPKNLTLVLEVEED